jgi:hypothetical protein
VLSVAALLVAVTAYGDPAWFGVWQVYDECESPGRLVAPGCTWTMSQEREDVKVALEAGAEVVRIAVGFTGSAREPAPLMRVSIDRHAWDAFRDHERLSVLQTLLRSWIAASDRGGCQQRCPKLSQFENGLEVALNKFTSGRKP